MHTSFVNLVTCVAVILATSSPIFALDRKSKLKKFTYFSAKMISGRDVVYFPKYQRRQKPSIVYFWTTKCSPSAESIPSFLRFSKKHPDIAMSAVALSDTEFDLIKTLALMDDYSDKHNVVMTYKEKYKLHELSELNIISLPAVFFVNGNGDIVWRIDATAVNWDSYDADKATEEFLKSESIWKK